VFRVPMLRNVAKTAPYFHDGSIESLDRAVRVMAELQLGKKLDEASVAGLVAFLESLTGEVPANYAPPGQRPER
jgi:cytochrome c peroxidase